MLRAADKNVRAPCALRQKSRPLRGLLFLQTHTLGHSHTRSAGGLRSSLARHACSALFLFLSSLT